MYIAIKAAIALHSRVYRKALNDAAFPPSLPPIADGRVMACKEVTTLVMPSYSDDSVTDVFVLFVCFSFYTLLTQEALR